MSIDEGDKYNQMKRYPVNNTKYFKYPETSKTFIELLHRNYWEKLKT